MAVTACVTETKYCKKCDRVLPLDSFGRRAASADGRHYTCKKCNNKTTGDFRRNGGTYHRRYHKESNRYARLYYARRKYGLTEEQYDELVAKSCEICGGRTKKMHVDHSEDGSYHGVLCSRCNMAIGLLKHEVGTIEAAASYVLRTRE